MKLIRFDFITSPDHKERCSAPKVRYGRGELHRLRPLPFIKSQLTAERNH